MKLLIFTFCNFRGFKESVVIFSGEYRDTLDLMAGLDVASFIEIVNQQGLEDDNSLRPYHGETPVLV